MPYEDCWLEPDTDDPTLDTLCVYDGNMTNVYSGLRISESFGTPEAWSVHVDLVSYDRSVRIGTADSLDPNDSLENVIVDLVVGRYDAALDELARPHEVEAR